MVSLWITLGLIIATFCVSALGATFSIVGLGALFSGAAMAVFAMAGSLEFAKFVLAAYIHQRWDHLNKILKSYLLFSIIVLSAITSMGIFGFLSDAYQSASTAIDAENIKLESLKTQQANNTNEIARLYKAIDEIPDSRISKKMKARSEAEPTILSLTKQNEQLLANITQSNMRMLEIKKKVGPLIYISRAFHMDIDAVVKYLILIFVSVFDPLAICLVIASSQALDSRKKSHIMATDTAANNKQTFTSPSTSVQQNIEVSSIPTPTANSTTTIASTSPVIENEKIDEILQMKVIEDIESIKKTAN